MPEEANPPPNVDWAKIPFPSDRLALGELRKRAHSNPEELEALAYNLVLCELELARDALLQYPPASDMARMKTALDAEKARELAALYIDMGVASGAREAQLLVENLRAAAVAHAPAWWPRGRG